MIQVDSLKLLEALPNEVEENELALIKDTQKVYVYKNKKWEEFHPDNGGLKLNLMELNSMAVTQLPALSNDEIKNTKKLISTFVKDNKQYYYMLLSNELKYYTVFVLLNEDADDVVPPIEDEAIGCLQDIGVIKSSEKTNDNAALEFWVTVDDKSYPFYFFDYTKGIIICK